MLTFFLFRLSAANKHHLRHLSLQFYPLYFASFSLQTFLWLCRAELLAQKSGTILYNKNTSEIGLSHWKTDSRHSRSQSKGFMFLFQCVQLIEDSAALPLLNKISLLASVLQEDYIRALFLFLSVTKYLSIKFMAQFGPNCIADIWIDALLLSP